MQEGRVKWFNNSKGYGFIEPGDGQGDVFVHYSAIAMDGYRTLDEGVAVRYVPVEGLKGLMASQVVLAAPDAR